MKVIILGGAGFIGSHLTDFLLKKKYKITVIDNLSTGRINNIKHIKKKLNLLKQIYLKLGNGKVRLKIQHTFSI